MNDDLIAVMETIRRSLVERDVARLADVLAEEYVFTTPIGSTLNRAERLEAIQAGRRPIQDLAYQGLDVRVYGETAVVLGRYAETAVGGGAGEEGRLTNVFVRRDDRWQMVAGQNTRVVELPAG